MCGRSFDLVTGMLIRALLDAVANVTLFLDVLGQINATESVYKRNILLNRGASIESAPMTPAQLHSTAVPGGELTEAATGEESAAGEHQGEGESESEEEQAPADDAGGRVANGVAPKE